MSEQTELFNETMTEREMLVKLLASGLWMRFCQRNYYAEYKDKESKDNWLKNSKAGEKTFDALLLSIQSNLKRLGIVTINEQNQSNEKS